MSPLSVVSWNINSVRLRLNLVLDFLEQYDPDVICLQETKCPDDKFPENAFKKLGYNHIAKKGQKGYHGVATISRIPFKHSFSRDFCDKGDARHMAVDLGAGHNIRVHNFYVPAGGDEPNPAINPKFEHKLAFLNEMKDWVSGEESERPAILVGDLNIAPLENDVWSHKQLLKIVSHTPVETELLEEIRKKGKWCDTGRLHVPEEEKLYSWWSYRAKDWQKANKGRRLDHIWVTKDLESFVAESKVLSHVRGLERPSDHAALMLKLQTL